MVKKIQLVTLGCSKNRVDSEHLLKQIFESGLIISPEGEDLTVANADIVVINTCGFINDAKEESINTILEMAKYKEKNLKALIVAGCLVERYKNEILQENAVCRRKDNGNGSILTLYNLEMITALAFRLKSRQAQYFREWIIEQALNPVILWKIPGMDTMLN